MAPRKDRQRNSILPGGVSKLGRSAVYKAKALYAYTVKKVATKKAGKTATPKKATGLAAGKGRKGGAWPKPKVAAAVAVATTRKKTAKAGKKGLDKFANREIELARSVIHLTFILNAHIFLECALYFFKYILCIFVHIACCLLFIVCFCISFLLHNKFVVYNIVYFII